MPCPNTLGSPVACAATSSVCMGLKSPAAPAYITRSVRVSVWDLTGASSPTSTSSSCSMAGLYLTRMSGSAGVAVHGQVGAGDLGWDQGRVHGSHCAPEPGPAHEQPLLMC